MKLFRVGVLCALAGSIAACASNDEGVLNTPDPVAGLRYVNLVSDTGAMDFRVVDVVSNAPNQVGAAFRAGGAPSGVPTAFLPPYQAVLADGNARSIRVFMSSANQAVASTVMFDTTFTFTPGSNYTMFLYGTARTGVPGRCCSALIVNDTVPPLTAGQIALRVVSFAATLAGNPAGVAANSLLDIRAGLFNAPVPAAASFPVVGSGAVTAYSVLDTAARDTIPYRLIATAAGAPATATAVFQATVPNGTRGNATSNPLAGAYVAGSAITALIVPQSVPGSLAPQSTPAATTTNIDSIVRSNDTVTVWRLITPATATVCAAPTAAGAANRQVIALTGMTQPEYNGAHTVMSTTAGAVPNRWTRRTITLGGTLTGAFTLSFGGVSTATLDATATAARVDSALGLLSTIGHNHVSVTGPTGGPYNVIFQGTFTNATVGALTASPAAGLTVTIASPAVGCGTSPIQTRDTVTLTGAVPTDSFRITVNANGTAQTTGFLPVTAVDTIVRNAVAALTGVGTGNVTVTGAAGGPYVVTFGGTGANPLNNVDVHFGAAMRAGSTGTLAVGKAAYAFAGAATSSRFRFRVGGAPASPATGTPSFKIVDASSDFTTPQVLFLIDRQPPRTAP